jgi:thiol-disulfide isomerase/thioredoxin
MIERGGQVIHRFLPGIVLILIFSFFQLGFAETTTMKKDILSLESIGQSSMDMNKNYELIIVDFWASWCDPCKESFPFYEKLIKEKKDKNILFISINLDDEKEPALKFLKEFPTTFPSYWDKSKIFMKKLNFDFIPYMAIFDGKWKLVDSIKGFNSKTRKKVKTLVEKIK